MILISGPCVIESCSHVRMMAEALRDIVKDYPVEWYFKASFDKANRTKLSSFRGPGFTNGLKWMGEVREDFGIKTTTDFHEVWQVESGGSFVDVVQIPAFLCKQTDLLVAAGKTGKTVNIKKGQFASVGDMRSAATKVGGETWFTERGTAYGRELLIDYNNIPLLKSNKVIMDCTHPSCGPMNALYIAKRAIVSGVNGIFAEVHDNPKGALCDGNRSIPLDDFRNFLDQICSLWEFSSRNIA